MGEDVDIIGAVRTFFMMRAGRLQASIADLGIMS
jgi:hypothetical protein